MKVFGIVARIFGLILLIYAIWYIVYGMATLVGLSGQQTGKAIYFLSGITFLALSLYLLRGAPHIMKFSYPEEAPSSNKLTPNAPENTLDL